MHQITRSQIVSLSLEEAWEFFSSPKNLKFLTPDALNFQILKAAETMYPGMIIIYKVSPLFNIPITWVTEITHIHDKSFFVDEQRVGPYSMWHHEHHFKEVEGGVEIKDIITYKLPLGFIGKGLNALFVEKQINEIFDYRNKKMETLPIHKDPKS